MVMSGRFGRRQRHLFDDAGVLPVLANGPRSSSDHARRASYRGRVPANSDADLTTAVACHRLQAGAVIDWRDVEFVRAETLQRDSGDKIEDVC